MRLYVTFLRVARERSEALADPSLDWPFFGRVIQYIFIHQCIPLYISEYHGPKYSKVRPQDVFFPAAADIVTRKETCFQGVASLVNAR